MTLEVRTPNQEVYVNGTRRFCLGVNVTTGFRGYVATADFMLDPAEGTPYPGDEVRCRVGFDGDFVTIFAGTVDTTGLQLFPNQISVQCSGPLSATQRPIGVNALDAPVDEDGNPLPVLSWPHDDADTTEYTDTMIVTAILDAYGVPYSTIDGRGDVLAGPDVVGVITLLRTENGFDLIQQIDRAMGYRTFDDVDGRVRRVQYNGLPSSASGSAFTEGYDILGGSRGRSVREIINRATVTGDPDAGGGLFIPQATVQADSPTNPNTGRPYIPTPPGYQAEEFSTTILKTEAQCEDVAQRTVAEKNRIREEVSLQLAIGNARITPGQTCYVLSSHLGLSASILWLVEEVQHQTGDNGFMTTVQLVGGYGSDGGLNTNQGPVMKLTYVVEKEFLFDGSALYVIIADASESTDPDGAFVIPAAEATEIAPATDEINFNGIVLYEWDSTLSGEPNIINKGTRAIWTSTTDPAGETITVTGYDMMGKIGTTTVTIANTPGNPYMVRDLWTAEADTLEFTNTGGKIWRVFAVEAVGCCRMAASTFQLAWDAGGQLYKCTIEGLLVTPTTVLDATAASIRWAFPESAITGARCWAGGATGKIYFSDDLGVTWTLRGTIPGGHAVLGIEESPFAENDLAAWAGNTLWQSFDGATWVARRAHPNVTLVAASAASGFNRGFVVFRGATVAEDTSVSRILERDNHIAADFNRSTATISPGAGTYTVVYTYVNAGGETTMGPSVAVVLLANQVAMLTFPTWPGNVQYAKIYVKKGADAYRYYGTNLGANVVSLDHYPGVGFAAPPLTNTTLPAVAAPTTALGGSALAAAIAATVDVPAQLNAITMAIYKPTVYVAGLTPAATPMIWYGDATGPFTLVRGTYDDTYGEPRDIIRDGLFEDIVYGAAVEAFFKTVDGFFATIYKIKIPSGEGWKIGYGDVHALPPPQGALIWMGTTTVPDTGGHGVSDGFVFALTDDGFERRGASPLNGHVENHIILALTGGVLLCYSRQDVGGSFHPFAPGSFTEPNLFRSTDGGENWVDTGISPVNLVRVAGTRAYASTFTSGAIGGLWRSDNAGASWTQVQSFGSSVVASLFVCSGNPDLVVISRPGHTGRLYEISIDGGVSFANTTIDQISAGDVGGGGYGHITPDGLWLLHHDTGTSTPIWRSSLTGGAVRVATTSTEFVSYTFKDDGVDIYAYAPGVPVLRSTDMGASWTPYYDTDRKPSALLSAIAGSALAFVPRDLTNDGYVLPFWTGGGTRLSLASQTPTANPLDRWISLDAALAVAFPEADYHVYTDSAVRLTTE